MFAGLRGVGISQRYLDLIQKKVVEPVGLELGDPQFGELRPAGGRRHERNRQLNLSQTAVPNISGNDDFMRVSRGVGQGEFGTDLSVFPLKIDKNRLIRNQ